MWKTILAGTTALAIAGGALAYDRQGPSGERAQRWRPSAEDVVALTDARIAALRAGLKLNAEQDKNWPAMESAMRDLAKQRADRVAARAGADRPADPIERLALHADAMESRGAALKKLASAAGPLYRSLDEGQKHRFMLLARIDRRAVGGWGGRFEHHRHRGPGERHRGPDNPGGPQGGPPRPQ